MSIKKRLDQIEKRISSPMDFENQVLTTKELIDIFVDSSRKSRKIDPQLTHAKRIEKLIQRFSEVQYPHTNVDTH